MKVLAVLLITVITSAQAFWGEKNANWSPFFGSGTGHNNAAPWGANSNWTPFTTSGNWAPKYDAMNLSRYGARPQSLMQYRKDPRFYFTYSVPASQSMIKPSNWLTKTDFVSTLRDMGKQNKDFVVGDGFSIFDLSRDRVAPKPYKNDKINPTDNFYGKQSYELSPAASSTNRVNE